MTVEEFQQLQFMEQMLLDVDLLDVNAPTPCSVFPQQSGQHLAVGDKKRLTLRECNSSKGRGWWVDQQRELPCIAVLFGLA